MNEQDFRSIIEEVRERVDLASLIGSDTKLSPSGSVLKGSSPFNADRNPSLVVWPHTRTWRDFSGGGNAGGDCFEYVMRRSNCGFMQALQELASQADVELPGGPSDAQVAAELARINEGRRVQDLLTAAAAYYHGVLPSKIRREWYQDHYGFTDETVDMQLLGWADGHLYDHLTGLLGATRDEALSTGLFVKLRDGRVDDFFKNRLVFPYWSHGKVVYFIARATEHTGVESWEQAKYKKLQTHCEARSFVSPTVVNATFFNEDAARGADELLITEGVTDCISATQAGIPCISPVTVRFRKQDHEKLIALTARTKRVIICNDSEVNGSGEAGAVETAQALYAAGRDVRLATIPRPDGVEKVDLNDLVKRNGPDALKRLLDQARRYPEYLIEKIPHDTPKTELNELLQPVVQMIRAASPIEQEAYCDLLAKRFKLKKDTIRKLLPNESKKQKSSSNDDKSSRLACDIHKGEVLEDTDHYYILNRDEQVVISSFQLEPTQRIVLEDGEIIDADATSDKGRVYKGLRFHRDAWNSKRSFLNVLAPVDLQWTGSEDNIQGVLRLIASRSVPTRRGTLNLGLYDSPKGPRWVTKDGLLAPYGVDASGEDMIYVPSGASLPDRVKYQVLPDPAVEAAIAAVVLPNLLRLNTPEVILPILGWFFASILKPKIAEVLDHFPILMVWGSPGSGKSSLIMEVFWPMFGAVSAEPYSATETEFALLKLFSATNSVPVFIDEYKPFDMLRHRRNTLHRYMRRLYTGEAEERGKADQSIVTYKLAAPLCLAGETRPIESALVERIITANPDKDELRRNPTHAKAFAAIKTVNPNLLAAGIVRFLLGRNVTEDITLAKKIIDRLLQGRELPFRVRDNLTVMVLGLHYFEEYAQSLGVQLPNLDVETAINAILNDLLEGGGMAVKTGLDYFMEELSLMAVTGAIQHGSHYVYRNGLLALHFPSCHAAYCEHCRRIGFEGEVPDRKAMRRQVVECHRRGGYVKAVDELVCFDGRNDRRRAILIDLDEAKQNLTVDDFPQPSEPTSSDWRSWGNS